MSLSGARVPIALLLFAVVALLGSTEPTRGQANDEPEEGRFKTADGLRLNYLWWAGGKQQTSDSVILVPGYGYDSLKSDTKGQWTTLAKALQKEGYSVLMFDFRGHGKSADNRAMDKPELFCGYPFNRLSGQSLAKPAMVKELKKEKFSPGYYPFLVNDLTAARRFLDDKNDALQCNSGRVFVVAEGSICPLVMLWASTEFRRFGFGPKTKQDDPELISAGEDLCGLVFLSWQGSGGPGQQDAVRTTARVMADKQLGSTTVFVGNQVKKKVAMAFIYGDKDRLSATEAQAWFSNFRLVGKKEDKETAKYIREVIGAEKLSGIKLLDIGDKPKENGDKTSYLQNQIVDFLKATKTKSINGNNWKERKMENLDFAPVPLSIWGLGPAPK
jgi:hypothetical protein